MNADSEESVPGGREGMCSKEEGWAACDPETLLLFPSASSLNGERGM